MITGEHIRGFGYRATVSALTNAQQGLQRDTAQMAGLVFAGVVVAAAAWIGAVSLLGALSALALAGAATVAAGVHAAHLSATRDEAADRLIELGDFASGAQDPQIEAVVSRRRRCLTTARNRLTLASAVRRDARPAGPFSPSPPAARVLASCPSLAERIAEELECDQADERVVIEVNRLLSSGAAEWDRLDRIERLIDQSDAA